MIRHMAFAVALVAATQATALSCLAPSVEGTYRQAADSAEDYVIGVGSLSLVGPSSPPEGAVAQGGDINAMVGYTQPATFEGEFFTGGDFSGFREVPVTVGVTCVAAWCGAATEIEHGLFFFRLDDGAYTLTENACPGFSFPDAHPGMLEEVISCHQGSCNGVW